IKESYKTAKLGISEDITLKLNIAALEVMILCDSTQVQQVLMNMMNNARDAVKSSPVKCISVSLDTLTPKPNFFSRHEGLIESEYACLKISDTGYGISSEVMQNIFDPFYTTKEVGTGTGLGLSTAFGTVASHGGVIEVDSEPNIGTTFKVYLPLIQPTTDDIHVEKNQSIINSPKHETILLVDDDPLVLESMGEVLESLGYKLRTAKNGVEGLVCFKQNADCIALIITDVVMPVMSGLEMFQEIRMLNNDMPIVFMTGYDGGNVNLSDSEFNNCHKLAKPVHVAELSQTVQEMLH
ncbi:MAG: ATP-binding protein, partial [Mariprofundaceae bacterium]